MLSEDNTILTWMNVSLNSQLRSQRAVGAVGSHE
jgi:hypothetical protein